MNWDRIEGDSKHFKGNIKHRKQEIDDEFENKNEIVDKRHHLDGKKKEMQFIKIDEAENQLFDWQHMPKTRKHVRRPEHSINKMVKNSK